MLIDETTPAAPPWRRALGRLLGPRALLAAIVVGAVLRLGASVVLGPDDVNLHEFGTIGYNIVNGDGYSYHAVGPDGRVETDGERGDLTYITGPRLPSAFLPPGYTVLVAAAIAVGGDVDTVVTLLQLANVLAGAVATVLMFHLGTRLAGVAGGRAAAWCFALYPPMIYAATNASAVNFYRPLEMLVLLSLLVAAERTRLRAVAPAAGALGLLCLFRSEAIILVPLAALWLVLARRRLGRPLPVAAAAVLVSLALVAPGAWMVRNSVVFERPVLTVASSGGFNLWIGNHDGATGSQKRYTTPPETKALIDSVPPTRSYEVDVDRLYLQEALRSMAADPVETAVRDLRKLAMMLTVDVYDARSWNAVYLVSWFVLLALAVGGMLTSRAPAPVQWLLYGQLAFAVAIPTLFFVLARHRLGIEMVLCLFAGVMIARLADRPAVAG